MIKGIPIEMGGEEFIVPPLTLGQLRAHKDDRDAMSREDAGLEDQMAAAARIIHSALSRNYPDLTLYKIENELLDTGNFREVITAVLTGSGLKPAVSGEAAAARIGRASMGSSPPPADTAPETLTN